MATQAQLTPSLPPPTHLPRTSGATSQLTLLIRWRGRGRKEGGGVADSQEKGVGGGGAAPEQLFLKPGMSPVTFIFMVILPLLKLR